MQKLCSFSYALMVSLLVKTEIEMLYYMVAILLFALRGIEFANVLVIKLEYSNPRMYCISFLFFVPVRCH